MSVKSIEIAQYSANDGVKAMTLDEKIQQYARKLPHAFQKELLDFVQYLLMKAEQQEKQNWASLSLSSAMRDMEDEPVLYSLSDLQVIFA